jgi:hypothetical protein
MAADFDFPLEILWEEVCSCEVGYEEEWLIKIYWSFSPKGELHPKQEVVAFRWTIGRSGWPFMCKKALS